MSGPTPPEGVMDAIEDDEEGEDILDGLEDVPWMKL